MAKSAAWITQTYPANTGEILPWIRINPQHMGRIGRGDWSCGRSASCLGLNRSEGGSGRANGSRAKYGCGGQWTFRCLALPLRVGYMIGRGDDDHAHYQSKGAEQHKSF